MVSNENITKKFNNMAKEILHNGKSCRFYISGSILVSADGTVAGMYDRVGHVKNLPIKTDKKGKYVTHDWKGRVNIDLAVITCFCPPKPNDGKRYYICHKDGDIKNCKKENLVWKLCHYHQTTMDSISIKLNRITYTVFKDGTIKRGGVKEFFHDNQYDQDMDLESCLDIYIGVPRPNSIYQEKFYVDDIMRLAGYVQGDDAVFTNPVILHRDKDWSNFASDNLEWVEESDQRYLDYLKKKNEDMKKRSQELNKGKIIPTYWI